MVSWLGGTSAGLAAHHDTGMLPRMATSRAAGPAVPTGAGSLRTICVIRRAAALGCAETVQPFFERDSTDAARFLPLLRYIFPDSPMVGAWRMMVMHARDPARGMITLYVFARRVVRSVPTVVRSVPTANVATRHRDGVRSATAAERTAAMTTSATSTATAMSTASASTTTVATAATAGGC
jgi:hypothetical protein